MNKTATIIAATLFLIVGGAYASQTLNSRQEQILLSPEAAYFAEQITELAVKDVGQPIEGFDPSLLMVAFPGLASSDFEGVQSLEGHYEVRGEMIEHVRDNAMPITSAERMVTQNGYATLLANVSKRFQIDATDQAAVDSIIAALNTSDLLQAKLGEAVSSLGVKIVPLVVLEDSRCPANVNCVWAGTVRLEATLESALGAGKQVFEIGKAVTTEAEEVTLEQVLPETHSEETIDPLEYRFYFRVTKR